MICYNPVLFNEYRNTKSCWNVLGVAIFELTWLSFWNIVGVFFLLTPPPSPESTCCIYVKKKFITLYEDIKVRRIAFVCQSSKHIFTWLLYDFFICFISCRCAVFQKKIFWCWYDIKLSIQMFHLFVIFTWCN